MSSTKTKLLNVGAVAGLFAGNISNVTVDVFNIELNHAIIDAGGIVGRLTAINTQDGYTIDNCSVSNMTTSELQTIGGIVGVIDGKGYPTTINKANVRHIITNSKVTDCAFKATTVDYAGVIVGAYVGLKPNPSSYESARITLNGSVLTKPVGSQY